MRALAVLVLLLVGCGRVAELTAPAEPSRIVTMDRPSKQWAWHADNDTRHAALELTVSRVYLVRWTIPSDGGRCRLELARQGGRSVVLAQPPSPPDQIMPWSAVSLDAGRYTVHAVDCPRWVVALAWEWKTEP